MKTNFTEVVDLVGHACLPFTNTKIYVSTGAVDKTKIIDDACETVSFEDKPSRANLSIEPGTILFAKMKDTEKVLYVDNDLAENIYSTGFFAVKPKKEIIEKKTLYYLLLSDSFNSQKNKHSSGATQKAITNQGLKKIVVNVPSLNDQKRMIAILDQLSLIIINYRQQLILLDNLAKSRFVEMFGNPIENPNGYPVHQLSDHILFLTSGSRGWAKYCVDNGNEWFITIKNVKDCHISTENMQLLDAPDNAEAKRTRVQEGDLLVSITADLGRTGVVTKEIANHGAYINQHLTCIRLNRNALEPLYVAHYLESPAGKEQFISKNQSAVKAGLNFNSIHSLKLIIPPKDKQMSFINYVERVDNSKAVVQKALDEAQVLFDSLMHQYFG